MSAPFFCKALKFSHPNKPLTRPSKLRFLLVFSVYMGVSPEAFSLTTDRDSTIGISGASGKKAHLTIWGNLNVGVISTTTDQQGTIIATKFLYGSDSRLKRDIQPLEQALDKALKLQGVSYYWKDSAKGESQQIGLIAQQVEKVYPQLVSTGSGGYKSVHYGNVVAILIEAIKQQQQQIKSQQQQIDKLNRLVVENQASGSAK